MGTHMLEKLTTESSNPASEDLDLLSSLELVQLINSEDAKIAAAVARESEAIAQAIDKIVACLRAGGRLIYVGAGTSGRLGVLDAVECPPTFNTDPEQIVAVMAGGFEGLVKAVEGAEDSAEMGRADLLKLNVDDKDCVVGITASGRTPFVLGALQYAREQGAVCIGFSCNEQNALKACSDLRITPVVGPEVISGSTRLKAGTATKMVLNMLTTGAMVCLGKTFGNYMVDVQATNEKLEYRASKMLAQLAKISESAARELLASCDWQVKTAVLMHHRKLDARQARVKLLNVAGHLRKAMQT